MADFEKGGDPGTITHPETFQGGQTRDPPRQADFYLENLAQTWYTHPGTNKVVYNVRYSKAQLISAQLSLALLSQSMRPTQIHLSIEV